MRTIEWTSQFKRDYKRESKGQHRMTLDNNLSFVVDCLANDQPLESSYHDHPLTGN
jgi:mRNA interferase YafQ